MTLNVLIILVIILFLTYFLIKFIRTLLSIPNRLFLSNKLKSKADYKFNKLLMNFKWEHNRNPTKNELFRIIINASHITIRRRGYIGHWGRQKVRKYLLEKYNVVNKYIMR